MDVVTGAFSYTGSYIARRLLASGCRVRTLSRLPDPRHELADEVEFAPLDFADAAGLVRALRGADTLYNTYWMRFPRGKQTFAGAVANTRTLLAAAKRASVRRVVHISVTNASPDSPLAYFRGKALAEEVVRRSGISYAIVRPTLTFGLGDILVNDIAWMLRHLPFFVIPGDGRYRVQPVSAEDVAEIAVEAGARGEDRLSLDAAGPDVFEFNEFVALIKEAVAGRAPLVRLPVSLAVPLARAGGLVVRDIPLTRQEVAGLEAGLLISSEPAAGSRTLSSFVFENADRLGRTYVSELARNFRPYAPV